MPNLNASRPNARWMLDGLVVAGLLALVVLLGCFRQRDADIWWHLKTGEMILERGTLPQKDWFTFTSADQDWIDLHWLFQVAATKLFRVGGMELLTVASATLGAIAVGVLLVARRSGWSWPVSIACWLPVVFLLAGRMYVRPEVVTLVCMAASLTVYFHAIDRPRILWVLLPLQLLWVNVQGLFVLGIVLASFSWIEGAWLRLRSRAESRLGHRTAILCGLIGVSLLNPYHLHGLLFPLELFRKMSWDADLLDRFGNGENFYSKHISELQSIPQFIAQAGMWNLYVLLHFGVSALAAISFLFIWSRRRFDLFRLLSFAAFAWLGLQATRNSGQFAIVAGAVTSWNFSEWFAARRKRATETGTSQAITGSASTIGTATAPQSASRRSLITPTVNPLSVRAGLLLILMVAVWSVATGRFYAIAGEGRLFGLGEHPLWHAHDAARFAAQLGMPDRMLAFHLGHAAVFEFHKRDEQRTLCDPRLEVVSRAVLEEYHSIEAAMAQDQPGWPAALGRHNVRMILTDHRGHYPIEATLLRSPEWRCVHFDPVAAVFVRDVVAREIGIAPVDFSTVSWPPPAPVTWPSRDSSTDSKTRLAESLYLVGRTLGERSASNAAIAHQLLTHAARLLASQAAVEPMIDHVRLLGQVSFSLSQLPPRSDHATDQRSPTEWLSEAQRAFHEAIALRPDDFISLAHLYTIAQLQNNDAAQFQLGDRILSLRHTTPARRIIRDRIAAELAEIRRAAAPASREDRSPDSHSR